VLISVKLWDIEAAARAVKPAVGPQTAVLSLQNGVTKDDVLRREFGEQAVMGGVGYVATHISRPGVIHQTGAIQRMVFGEYDGRRSPRPSLLAAALEAGIGAELSSDVHGRSGRRPCSWSGFRAPRRRYAGASA
jgi:2-dehydropantoate 2-reductase